MYVDYRTEVTGKITTTTDEVAAATVAGAAFRDVDAFFGHHHRACDARSSQRFVSCFMGDAAAA